MGHRIGLPDGGVWRKRLNSDAACYRGSGVGNGGAVVAKAIPWMGRPHFAALTLPPLAALVLVPKTEA